MSEFSGGQVAQSDVLWARFRREYEEFKEPNWRAKTIVGTHLSLNHFERLIGPCKISRIRNRVSIEQRPAKVDSRRRFGDCEGDTIYGADHSGMIMTCVEGKSEFLITAKMKDGTSVRLSAVKERTSRQSCVRH